MLLQLLSKSVLTELHFTKQLATVITDAKDTSIICCPNLAQMHTSSWHSGNAVFYFATLLTSCVQVQLLLQCIAHQNICITDCKMSIK